MEICDKYSHIWDIYVHIWDQYRHIETNTVKLVTVTVILGTITVIFGTNTVIWGTNTVVLFMMIWVNLGDLRYVGYMRDLKAENEVQFWEEGVYSDIPYVLSSY